MNNPLNFIKNIKVHIKELKEEADSKLKSNIEYLESGIWKVNNTLTVFYKKKYKNESRKESFNIFGVLSKNREIDYSTKIARKIFMRTYKFKICVGGGLFKGQVLITSTWGKTERIVNYGESKLLTKYKYLQTMQNDIEKRKLWGKYFNTVPIYESNYEKLFNIEKYIITQNCDYDLKFKHILNDYILFSQNCESEKVKIILSDKQKNDIKNSCRNIGIEKDGERAIEAIIGGKYIKCLSHGDMCFFNVLYDGKDNYYIDMEFIGKRFFLFDLFRYLWWSITYKNLLLIKDYFGGKYDKYFSDIFANYGLKYNKNDRKAYFIIYLLEEMSFNCENGFGKYNDILKL